MPVDNIIKARKRYASNVMWMTALYNYMATPNSPIVKALTDWKAALEADLDLDVAKKFLKITDNPELIGFRQIAYDIDVNGNVTRYNPDKLKQQIIFEVKCLPAQIRNLAVADNDELEAILAIMYLTRKDVAIAEGICMDKRMHKYLTPSEAQEDASLWADCMRVRSSTFSTMAPQIEEMPTTTAEDICKWAIDMAEFYKKWGKKTGAPFYGNRRPRDENAIELHRDDPILTSWAGIHSRPVITEKSVLGMVERVFNLPERCDISGTATDALGYGLFAEKKINIANPDLFVFLNIYGMILSGHHSLFETNAGASLWSSTYYAPFEPLSILNVLGNIFKSDGRAPDNDRQLKTLYNGLKTVVTTTQTQEPGKSLKEAYWYVQNLWRDLAGMILPGTPDKPAAWGEGLELTQPLYVMAEKLCSLANNLKFD